MVFTLFFTYRRERECLGTPFSLANDFKTKTGINQDKPAVYFQYQSSAKWI